MATTTRGAFPYPADLNQPDNVPADLQALADRVAAATVLYDQGAAADRPAATAAREGMVWYSEDTGSFDYCYGAGGWKNLNPKKTVRIPHTFTLSSEVKVASGDDFYVPPFFVPAPAGQTVTLVAARHRINSGTSATVELRKNGAAITGFTGLSVTTTTTTTDPSDVALADGDALSLVVTAVSGTPKNLSLSVYLAYEV